MGGTHLQQKLGQAAARGVQQAAQVQHNLAAALHRVDAVAHVAWVAQLQRLGQDAVGHKQAHRVQRPQLEARDLGDVERRAQQVVIDDHGLDEGQDDAGQVGDDVVHPHVVVRKGARRLILCDWEVRV
jgi:hypothetical protein